MELLKQLCKIHAPAGSEAPLTDFVLNYIQVNKKDWKVQPEIFHGDGFQDCIVLVFGKPKTAIFAEISNFHTSPSGGAKVATSRVLLWTTPY